MDANRRQEIKDEMALKVTALCGSTGVLNAVDNKKLTGDTKVRHKNALNEAKKKFGEKGAKDPHIQAIYARIYGLI